MTQTFTPIVLDAEDYYGAMLATPDEPTFCATASSSGPMLGTLTVDRWGKRLRRFDRPTDATMRRLQKHDARRSERNRWAADYVEALARTATPIVCIEHDEPTVPTGTMCGCGDIATVAIDFKAPRGVEFYCYPCS